MKMGKEHVEETIDLPMTPMIDIVFQLLIFFMVCSTISDIVGNVKVVLPVSHYAAEDINPPPDRLVINIEKNGEFKVGGSPRSDAEMQRLIAIEAKTSQDKTNKLQANRSILMRVDQGTKFRRVQQVMGWCTDRGLWKLSFAALSKEAVDAAPDLKKEGS